MAAGHLALLCLGISLLAGLATAQRSQRCAVVRWRPQLGPNPLPNYRGKVLLVAILRGYCSYCVQQARRLETLKNSLASEGFSDIAMLVVNGGEPLSRSNVQNLIDASNIPVLQDNANNTMSRFVFRGNKDDFVVFDRCGHRAVYIPHPYSYLGNNITERILKVVHRGEHDCHCNLDPVQNDPHNVMYGDQVVEEPNYRITADIEAGGHGGPNHGRHRNSQNRRRHRNRHRQQASAGLGGQGRAAA